jgi:hypothetical protein
MILISGQQVTNSDDCLIEVLPGLSGGAMFLDVRNTFGAP